MLQKEVVKMPRFDQTKDYYGVLLTAPTATAEEITASWRRLAAACHPDLHPGAEEVATRRLQELNEARDVLTDPAARVAYDAARAGRLRDHAPSRQARQGMGRASAPTPAPREWIFPWWSVVLAAFVFLPAGMLMLILNFALRNRHIVIRSRTPGSRPAGRRMAPTAKRLAAFGVLFLAAGALTVPFSITAAAPAGSAAASLAAPVTLAFLACVLGMAYLALAGLARLAAARWAALDPGQRRAVLLDVGAWLLWRSFWREMRRVRAG